MNNERFKIYGPGVKVSVDTLDQIRRERDELGVVDIELINIGGPVRSLNLSGVMANNLSAEEVVKGLKETLRISSDKKVVIASVVDPNEAAIASKMSRTRNFAALVLSREHYSNLNLGTKKHPTSDMEIASQKNFGRYLLKVSILPREKSGKSSKGGTIDGETSKGPIDGEGYYKYSSGLFRELFNIESIKPMYVGSHEDYVAFLVIPPDYQMGDLPIWHNSNIWKNKTLIEFVLVPKELV